MRLWTLHPRYLDTKGLVALWRETLLAQKVLRGKTKGYRHHPQLQRFKALENPVAGVATYLYHIYLEARERNYAFDIAKVATERVEFHIEATSGQLEYEWLHLKQKLKVRDKAKYEDAKAVGIPDPHPLFFLVPGDIASWEVITS